MNIIGQYEVNLHNLLVNTIFPIWYSPLYMNTSYYLIRYAYNNNNNILYILSNSILYLC